MHAMDGQMYNINGELVDHMLHVRVYMDHYNCSHIEIAMHMGIYPRAHTQ